MGELMNTAAERFFQLLILRKPKDSGKSALVYATTILLRDEM